MIGLGDGSPPTLLAFLSSGCTACEHLCAGRPAGLLAAVRLFVVVKAATAESPVRVRALAPSGAPVVMSTAAWLDYAVSASPYFVYLEGGRVQGEGSASGFK